MRRQRLTWQQRGGADRRASAHPAYPDEGPASPAYKPDPEADAYENGDTSSWAEDPHPGPYPNSAHPAYPDEGPASPAYKAASLERALEKKAARCLRLASALMGPGASQLAVEDQALSLMDLSDRAINASLARLAGDEEPVKEEAEDAAPEKAEAKKKARTIKALLRMIEDEDEDEDEDDDEPAKEEAEDAAEDKAEAKSKKARTIKALLSMIADEDEDEAVEDAEEVEEADEDVEAKGKKATADLAAEVAALRLQVASLQKRIAGEDEGSEEDKAEDKAEESAKEASDRAAYGWAMTPHKAEENMLEAMLAEEGMGADHDPEVEAMLAEMMTEADAPAAAPAAPAEAMYEADVAMDPLGVLTDDDAGMGLTDDDYMLASLFGMKAAAEDEGSKEDAAEDKAEADAEDKKEEAAKKEARLRPQPKTASTGATRLGGGVIGKAAASEVSELSALWESAPDVSKFF